MKLTHWSPFHELESLQNRVNKLFTDSVGGTRGEDLSPSLWYPPVDIQEESDRITLYIELPGLTKDDITIGFEDKVLTISGERKFEHEDKRDNFHRVERNYGRFSRRFAIAKPVKVEDVSASFQNGVLKVVLPKAEEVKAKQIPINVV